MYIVHCDAAPFFKIIIQQAYKVMAERKLHAIYITLIPLYTSSTCCLVINNLVILLSYKSCQKLCNTNSRNLRQINVIF